MELNEQQALLARLDVLREKGEALQRATAATQSKMLELFKVPETGAVSAEFDASGIISALEIDDQAKTDLTPDQLGQEITFAILRATKPIAPAQSVAAFAPGDSREIVAPDAISSQILKTLSSGALPEPVPVANDFGTVTITALWGNIVAVKCSPEWILSTPARLIAEEIVRMGQIAARESDTLGRFSNGGPRNG